MSAGFPHRGPAFEASRTCFLPGWRFPMGFLLVDQMC